MPEKFFADWVPDWLGNILIFALLLPLLCLGGIYTPTVGELVGGLGTLSEYFILANYCATIGMVVGATVLLPILRWLPTHRLLAGAFLVLLLVHVGCALSTSPVPIVLLNLLGGFAKIIGLIVLIQPAMQLMSPKGERYQFYAIFNPLVISGAQAAGVLSSYLVYLYNWQAIYAGFMPVLVLCLVLVLVSVRPRAVMPIPWAPTDWLAVLLLTAALLLVSYIGAFGRMEDWWASPRIRGASLLAVVSGLWFVYRDLTQPNPLVSLRVLGKGQVLLSCVVFLLLGIFLAGASVLNPFLAGILRLNAPTITGLNLWLIPGLLLGGGYCYWWFRRQRGFKGILLLGFGAFTLSYGLLYFLIAPTTSLPDFYVPTMLRGVGMAIIFVAGGVLINDQLSPADASKVVFYLLLTRSLLSIVIFSTVFTTATYRTQIRTITLLAQSMDAADPRVLARTQPAAQAAVARGDDARTATQQTLYGLVRPQATMLTARALLGYIAWAGLATLALLLVLRIDPLNRRRLVHWRRRLRGQPMLDVEGL